MAWAAAPQNNPPPPLHLQTRIFLHFSTTFPLSSLFPLCASTIIAVQGTPPTSYKFINIRRGIFHLYLVSYYPQKEDDDKAEGGGEGEMHIHIYKLNCISKSPPPSTPPTTTTTRNDGRRKACWGTETKVGEGDECCSEYRTYGYVIPPTTPPPTHTHPCQI